MGAAAGAEMQGDRLLEDPSAWAAASDDDDAAAPPATPLAQKARLSAGMGATPSSSSSSRRPPGQTTPSTAERSGGLHRGPSYVAEGDDAHDPDPMLGQESPVGSRQYPVTAAVWNSEQSYDPTNSDNNGPGRSLRHQSSALSTQSRISMVDISQKARGGFRAAMSLLGFSAASDATTAQDVAAEVFELALSICLATAPDVTTFVEAFGSEDKRALRRLFATAKRAGIIGAVSSQTPVPLSELARAFLAQGPEVRPPSKSSVGGSGSGASNPSNGRSMGVDYGAKNLASSSSLSLSSPGVGHKSSVKRQVTFEGGEDDDSGEGRRQTLGAAVRRSTSRLGMERQRSDLEKTKNLNRSISDLSCTSFTDFNRKNNASKASSESLGGPMIRPSFLDFVSSLEGAGRGRGGGMPAFTGGNAEDQGVQMVMDIALPGGAAANFGANTGGAHRSGFLDTVSEAGMSYHSSYDMQFGSEGEKETVQAEVISVTGTDQNGQMRIAFRSRCLRTQNEWQKHLLNQHRTLLNMVSTKLKAKEMEVQAGDELRDEQKELLRGFRKIIVREVAEEENSKSISLYIVERDDRLRQEMEDLCTILEYPFQAFRGLTNAVEAIRDESGDDVSGRRGSDRLEKIESDKSLRSPAMRTQAVQRETSDEHRKKREKRDAKVARGPRGLQKGLALPLADAADRDGNEEQEGLEKWQRLHQSGAPGLQLAGEGVAKRVAAGGADFRGVDE